MGLNTLIIHEHGTVTLYRLGEFDTWETGKLLLSSDDVNMILENMTNMHLMSLHREYHAMVHDGTQWVLWIQQGEQTKSVYFNNHFPQAIRDFSEFLDRLLLRRGLLDVSWEPDQGHEWRHHEHALWESIQ